MTLHQIEELEQRRAYAGLHPPACPCSFCRCIRRGQNVVRLRAGLPLEYPIETVPHVLRFPVQFPAKATP